MEPTSTIIRHEVIDPGELLVHEWRVAQLKRLGIPGPVADEAAGHVDWHQGAVALRNSPSTSSADRFPHPPKGPKRTEGERHVVAHD